MHLLEIPEPPEIIYKSANPSKCGSSSIRSSSKPGCAQSVHDYHHDHHQQQQQIPSQPSSTIFEAENESTVAELYVGTPASGDSVANNLKDTIGKLVSELNETKREIESTKRMNTALEDQLANEIVAKRITENVQMIEMKKTMGACQEELDLLRQQYSELQAKNELEQHARHETGSFVIECDCDFQLILFYFLQTNLSTEHSKWPVMMEP